MSVQHNTILTIIGSIGKEDSADTQQVSLMNTQNRYVRRQSGHKIERALQSELIESLYLCFYGPGFGED